MSQEYAYGCIANNLTYFESVKAEDKVDAVMTKADIAASENCSNTLMQRMFKTEPEEKNQTEKNKIFFEQNGVVTPNIQVEYASQKYGFNLPSVAIIMPNIVDVRVNDNKGTAIVYVDFADDTTEKAVLHKDDTFSLEQGISVCITKKLLSANTNGNGSSVYNKIIKRGLKVFKISQEAKQKVELAEKAEKEKAQRIRDKKAKRRAKQREKQKQYEIDVHKQAIVAAMKELNKASE